MKFSSVGSRLCSGQASRLPSPQEKNSGTLGVGSTDTEAALLKHMSPGIGLKNGSGLPPQKWNSHSCRERSQASG
jgi:hypothetical protein